MVLVQFTDDFLFTSSADKKLTNGLTIKYFAGTICEVEDECALFATAIGACEVLDPPEAGDDDDDGEAV